MKNVVCYTLIFPCWFQYNTAILTYVGCVLEQKVHYAIYSFMHSHDTGSDYDTFIKWNSFDTDNDLRKDITILSAYKHEPIWRVDLSGRQCYNVFGGLFRRTCRNTDLCLGLGRLECSFFGRRRNLLELSWNRIQILCCCF